MHRELLQLHDLQVTPLTSSKDHPSTSPVQPDLIPDNDTEMKLSQGLLITFEGGEGSGKTTQATRLASRMEALGISVVHAREPGGTRLGEQIRSWVKRESDTDRIAEILLFAAARTQLITEIVAPALRKNSVVVLDRFIDSTVAYQGYGRGTDIEQVHRINEIASGGLVPDLTVLLDADPKVTLGRVGTAPDLFNNGKKAAQRTGDRVDERRFEREPLSFHQKVRTGYLELAKDGDRWSVIKADQAQHRIADAIWKRVRPLLVERGVDEGLLVRKQGSNS